MSTKTDAARAYVRVCGEGQAASDAAEAYIAEDVDLVKPPLHVYGRPGVMERISGHWPGMCMYAAGTCGDPREDGDVVMVHADMAPNMPTKAVDITFKSNEAGNTQHVEVRNGQSLHLLRRRAARVVHLGLCACLGGFLIFITVRALSDRCVLTWIVANK